MIVNAVYIKEVRDGGGRTSKFSLIGSDLEYTADASYAELTKQWEQILR